MDTTYSQAAQDLFVLKVLDNKKDGVFLEIGSTHPVIANNGYLCTKKKDQILIILSRMLLL